MRNSTLFPWLKVVGPAMIGVVVLLVLGTWLIDESFAWQNRQIDPRYTAFKGSCYYAGDARNYMRIALDGYSNYAPSLSPPHMTLLNDRSWWPLFPRAISWVIALGGGACGGRTVNGIALVALVPIFQAITRERRWWRLLVLGVLPSGAWMYVGEADSFFLALSAALVWIILQSERHPRLAGIGAFGMGIIVGLAKPNGLALIPALGVWGIEMAIRYYRAEPVSGSRWRVVKDGNPAWAAWLGALGVLTSTVWWIYQTSGFYPYYVLMLQRSLWWREFEGGNPSSFAYTFYLAIQTARNGFGGMLELQRMAELASMVMGLALVCAHLPPRWPGGERISIPLHWRIGVLAVFVLMFQSGQSHAVDRYAVSNVFFVLVWYRVLFGTPEQPVTWRIWTLPGLLRWAWLAAGVVLWVFAWLLLGWQPLG